jgi:hypothetical protein
METIVKYGKKFLNLLGIETIVRLLKSNSAINQDGWYLSVKKKKPLDKDGNAIPWFTYASIDFLKNRIQKTHHIFEYGSGGSSIWFSKHAQSVDSVEHHEGWYNKIIQLAKPLPNLKVSLVQLKKNHQSLEYAILAFIRDDEGNNNYINHVNTTEKKYHIVIIDGLFRNDCLVACLSNLTKDGIIILDNTNYSKELDFGIKFMRQEGFKQLDFWGMIPIFEQKSCTTIFYKYDNCLGL